ncbi:MAG TPA: hypothetical protein VJ798_02825, partial [Rhizomicrobium sp.]|nr:hypothetical protein [Rhizomicrobium sp.]
GYTNASGFNLVSSVVRDNRHLVAVVMGGRTAIRRDLEMIRILDAAFVWRTRQDGPRPAMRGASSRPQL